MDYTLEPYIVYVQTDEQGRITAVNSSAFVSTDWGTEIDRGYGDKYYHAQGNYFPESIYINDGIPRYKLVDGQAMERTEEEIEQDRLPNIKLLKEKQISSYCNKAIIEGMDITTSKGIEHFSLQETDQINLTTALAAVQQGASVYPYHADKSLCRMFTAEEIKNISQSVIQHKLYHTTLCNHLLTWIRRSTSREEIENISYSAENLPDDLAQNMLSILSQEQSYSL